jgi:hypothetical protein
MLSENEVNNCDVTYLHHRWVGTCHRLQIEERSKFEVARWQTLFGNMFQTKTTAAERKRVSTFPWENEKTKPKLPEKTAERLKQYGASNTSK